MKTKLERILKGGVKSGSDSALLMDINNALGIVLYNMSRKEPTDQTRARLLELINTPDDEVEE